MDKEQAKRVRQFMRDSGIKHYIYPASCRCLVIYNLVSADISAPSKQGIANICEMYFQMVSLPEVRIYAGV